MNRQSQQVNSLKRSKSVFLDEQLNNQLEPSEDEILQRAQQLEITDLELAKQSLTMAMSSQWKPYCNRYQDIYFLNLQQQKAYIDHPIDMYFKRQFAKRNKLPMPSFQSFEFHQIAKSLELIKRQIQKYHNRDQYLNVVYQQSDQHQEQSVGGEPTIQLQLTQRELQQLEIFQQQLRTQNLKWLSSYEQEKEEKLKKRQNKLQTKIQNKRKIAIQQHMERIEKQIDIKNKHSFTNNISQYQQELIAKKTQLEQLLDRQIELRRNINITHNHIENAQRKKNILNRIRLIKNAERQINFNKNAKVSKCGDQMCMQINKDIIFLNGQKYYEQALKKHWGQIEKGRRKNRKPIFNYECSDCPEQTQEINRLKYLDKLRQISKQVVWSTSPITFDKTITKKSLGLRLWKKTL